MANEAQREYWNSAPGEKWVANQARLDRQMQEVTTALWRRAAPAAGERALDVGCGAGETTLAAARRVAPAGAVLGVDISEPLLELARERVRAANVANVELLAADAQTHPFPPESFDLVYSRFGVMFFEDPTAAFRNLRAALKPGGRLRFVCWAGLEANPFFRLPLVAAARLLGPLDPPPPRAPGPMAFADRDYVAEALSAAGFAAIDVEPEQVHIVGGGTPAEEAAFMLQMGPVSRLLAERGAGPEAAAEIARDLADALRPYATPDGVRTPATIYCVTAARSR